MNNTLLLDSQYFPCIDYFILICQHEQISLEFCENFQKQTARNRCYIRGANKVERLTVPVLRPSGQKIKTSDIQVSTDEKWKREHWRAIETAYANAPFFEFYADPIRDELFANHEKLFDLNTSLLKLILKLLNISKSIVYTPNYDFEVEENTTDFRGKIATERPIQENYASYFQIFGEKFTPNLSILDLLFCEGNNSIQFLK